MPITLKDIAKVCNVSYSTVSRAINNKNIRPSAKMDEIRETAKALGYSPNVLAVQLVKRRTKIIGLIIPDIANPHYSEITKCVEDAALERGYQVFLCNSDWNIAKEKRYRDLLIEHRVAGMVVMPVSDESHILFRNLDIPIVLLGSRTKERSLNTVVMDNHQAAFLATEYLIKKGCTKLAYIGRRIENYTSSDRIRGYKSALQAYGIADQAASLINSDSFQLEGGYTATKKLLRQPNRLNGIIAFNDFIAIGAMQAVEEEGYIVGSDIAIIGFDNVLYSALPKISLTTVTPSNEELAKKAVAIIISYVEENEKEVQHLLLPPKLIFRSTC